LTTSVAQEYDAVTLMTFRKEVSETETVTRPKSRNFGGLLTLLLFAAAIICFLYVGKWLVVEDPLDHAQAIAILSGRMPERALEAARLYRGGYAPEVWLTHSTEPGKSLKEMGVEYFGEDYYNQKILLQQGVPVKAIRVLDPPILNTADEIVSIKGALNAAPLHIVIIVTTKPHTRRTRTLWRILTHDESRAIIRAASTDPFDADHWWRSTRDALDVVREVLGLMNAWAGLPLVPSPAR
jgi:uncharacterized SAM-binding protein YcdF (DUF218 family)